MTLAEQFLKLFDGNKRAHGVFNPEEQRGDGKRLGVYKIIKEPPTEELWQQHLDGKQGLGIFLFGMIVCVNGVRLILIITVLTINH